MEDGGSGGEDFRRLEEFQEEYGPDFATENAPLRSRGDDGERDRKMDAMANAPATEQIAARLPAWASGPSWSAAERFREPGKVIINAIDDDGYLRTSLEELAALEPSSRLRGLQDGADAGADARTARRRRTGPQGMPAAATAWPRPPAGRTSPWNWSSCRASSATSR